jgi:hypothetical protein
MAMRIERRRYAGGVVRPAWIFLFFVALTPRADPAVEIALELSGTLEGAIAP